MSTLATILWIVGGAFGLALVLLGVGVCASTSDQDHAHHGSPAYHGWDKSTLSDSNAGRTDRKLCVTDREADRNPVYAEGYYGRGEYFRVWARGGWGDRNCRTAPANMHNHRVEEDTDGNPPGPWSIHH